MFFVMYEWLPVQVVQQYVQQYVQQKSSKQTTILLKVKMKWSAASCCYYGLAAMLALAIINLLALLCSYN